MKNNIAIFPGSFDPITMGHVNIINRSLQLFNKIIIAIGVNQNKNYMFNAKDRELMIKAVFKKNTNIIIKHYNELTVQFCQRHNVTNIIRGIRNSSDFEYEQQIAFSNHELDKEIDTIFLPSSKETIFISSSVVKDILLNNGELKAFIPEEITQHIKKFTTSLTDS
tara:strand:- start:597 stop:1094 length:498 start_codon:yes stop_codon:yes gene_type:complete